jgi:hypothetical protein
MKTRILQIVPVALIIFLFTGPMAQAVTYYSTATGSPTTLTLWNTVRLGGGNSPANFTTVGDVFIIQNAHVLTTTANWTVTGTVTVESGGRLAITSSGTTIVFGLFNLNSGATAAINRPFTVNGAAVIGGAVAFASTSASARAIRFLGDLTLNSGASWTEPATGNGASNTYAFGGNFTNNATVFNALGTGVHTFSGAAKIISGTTVTSIGSVAITGTVTNTGTLTVRTALTGAGTLTNGAGATATLNINGTATITTLAATAANNLVNYTGVAQTAKVTTYNNLTLSGSLAKTFATTPTVNGVLSMEGTATVVVTTGVVTYGTAATLQYNTATARNATAEEWITPFVATGGIIIKNTGAITTPTAVQIGNNTSVPLNINSLAILTPGNKLLTFHGDFINAGTLTSGAGGVTIAGTTATQSIAGFTTTGAVTLAKTSGTATLQGNVNGAALSVNGLGGTLNLGSTLTHTFTGDVSLLNGTLNAGSSTLNVNSSTATAWNGNSSLFTAGTGTVVFGGQNQTLAGTGTATFNNLTVSNSNVKTLTNVPTVNGVFSVEGTTTVTAAPTYGAASTLQYNTTTSRTAGVEWITPFVASGGVVIASTGTITMNAAKVFNATAPLTVNSGAALSMSTFLLTLNGDFVNNGGTASGTTGGVTIAGTAATQSIDALTTTGTLLMSKTAGTATFTGNINGAALTVNGSGGTLSLGTVLTHTFTGNVTLTAGTLKGGTSTINENSVSASAWNGSGILFVAESSIVNFGAAGAQTLAANSTFHNLKFSGSGTKTLSSATTVTNDLSITGAVLNLGSITTHASQSLTLGGTVQTGGSWGSSGSTATNKNDTYFTASSTGILNVSCTSPAAPTSGGNGTICAGATITALTVTVGAGETADWYSLSSGGTNLVTNSLSYTPASAGTYYAESRTTATGCVSTTRTGVTLNVNPAPALLSLTGSAICTSPGGNGTITSTTSVSGINYQLYDAGNNTVQSAKAGTGSALSWTGLPAANGYYVKGTNATTSCFSTSSTVSITETSNPDALSLTGSTVCTTPGGDGTITSSTSVSGINYQLYNASNNPVQSAQAGTGSSLAWATLAAADGFYVIGTSATTGCTSPHSNTVNVTAVATPVALGLTGSTICTSPGNNGTVTSSTSESGVNYQLFDNGDLEVGTPLAGTGSGLSWTGLAVSTGYYTIGTNATTFCISDASSPVDVTTTANPTITSSAAAAAVCYSASSQSSTLAYSAATGTPATYTITWNTAANTAGLVNVTTTSLAGSPISFPVAASVAAGTYTGTLAVAAGSCASAGNTFTMTVNTPPSAPTGTATQILCSGATVASLSATGTSILWYAAASGGSSLATSTVLVNGAHYYASQTVSGCESAARLNVTALVVAAGSWIGTTSTNWFTTTNWCGGTLPTATTDIIIPSGLTNYPSIGTTGAVCRNITIESGASLTITTTNTLTVSGNWTNNGTFTPGSSSTVDFNGTGNIGASNFNTITFSTTGTKTATGILSVAGNVSISAGTFVAGAFTHTVAGNWTKSGGTFTATGSTVNFTGSGTGSIGASNFENITFSGAGAKTATGILTIAGDVSITGNFTAGAYTHTVGGDWTKTGTFTHTGSTIDFNGSNAANIGAGNFNNVIFSGSGVKTATGALNIVGAVTISSNFSAGSYTHSLQGNWTNSGTFTAGTSNIHFAGSSAQTIGSSASSAFYNVTQEGAGGITLGIATSVTGTLTLTTGLVTIGAYDLTAGSTTGGSSASYVKTSSTGRLKQSVAGSGSVTKVYPVGNSAYNPMSVKYNDVASAQNFSIRVADATITNANVNNKTVYREWYLISDAAGSANLTLSATYNNGEAGASFSNSTTPKIGYFNGTYWAYQAITSGSGSYTFTATVSAPDFTNTSGYFVLGSEDAFQATKLAVTNIDPSHPTKGIPNTNITVQSQNSNSYPTHVYSATGIDLTATNTTLSTSPATGTIASGAYETILNSIKFTSSTFSGSYLHNAFVPATRQTGSGEALTAGNSGVFDVYDSRIYRPKADGNWNAITWEKSEDGGGTFADTIYKTTFSSAEVIWVPAGRTLTANGSASFYNCIVYATGKLDMSSGTLTLNHSTDGTIDYGLHVEGTLENSGGTFTNSNETYPIEIQGGTYVHSRNGGSIPVATWFSLGSTASTCQVTGITSTALTGGLNQAFQNFTWDNASQSTTVQNLSADMTVNGTLTLTAGKITTGSYRVIVGLNGTASNTGAGYINGNLRRYVPSTLTTVHFPIGDASGKAPFLMTATTGTPSGNGYLDGSTTAAQPPVASGLSQTKYINRKWTVSNNGVGGITVFSSSFTYLDGDKIGTPVTASLKLRKLTSSTWYTTNGAATDNTITASGQPATGLVAPSEVYVGEDDCSSTYAVWLGSTSTDWNTTTNWCSGAVPTATTDVLIPSSAARQPVIGSAGGSCLGLTIQSGATLTMSGAYTLDVHANWSNSGTFTPGTGAVSFTGTPAQTITGATAFHDLTINNTAGVSAANNLTVNGTLTLTSANKDATHGTLDMATYTLSMLDAAATVAGTGDVTGIVKRHHAFTPNVAYQFGSQFTALTFLNTGTQPDEISCRITIGAAPSWKTGAVQRKYSFAQTGTAGTDEVTVNLRYLESELNNNDETKLVLWDNHSGGAADEHGKTNNSTTNNWVGLSGFGIAYVAPSTLDNLEWGLADYSAAKNTWVGTTSTNWSTGTNWTAGHAPTATEDALIPDVSAGSNNFPVLSANVEIKTLEIASGATVTAGTFSITVNGYQNAWQNNGTFYPGTGSVNFTHNNLDDIVTIAGTTQFHHLSVGANTFVRPGSTTVTKVSGDVTAQLTSIVDLSALGNTVEYNGSTGQTIINPATTGFASTGYYNLIFSGTGTKTLYDGNLDIAGNFTCNSTMVAGTSGAVSFIGTSEQTISGSVDPGFYNLTVNNAAGVASSIDLTVNGTLDLLSDNPASLDKGTLAMATSKVLNMGANATTTGTGDVSGLIKRTHTMLTNTFYSFGNTNQGFSFPVTAGQTVPSSLTMKVTIGSAPCWGASCVTNPADVTRRYYELAQTGGSATKAILRVNYKDNELASGVNESLLSIWTYTSATAADKGWSNYDIIENYISISEVNMSVITATPGDFQVAIAPSSVSYKTWNGNVSTDWNNGSNWTPSGVPTTSYGAIIPDANSTVNQPTLPASGATPQATCKFLVIENNGVLNSGSSDGATITIVDGIVGDSWSVEAGGTFNAGNSTVIFATAGSDVASLSGSTDFYNLTVAADSKLRPAANSYIGILGTLTNSGTFSASTNENTVEFKGTGTQVIPNPNGGAAGYHNLVLSSSGTKTLPSTLNIVDEFINNASGTVNSAITAIFNSTYYGQLIGGTTITTFTNLTIDNSDGVSLSNVDLNVTGTLTFTSGKLTTGSNRITVGTTSSCSAGTITGAGTGKYVDGNLRRYVPNTSAPTVDYPVGDATNYTPISVEFAGTTSGCGYLDASAVAPYQPPVVSGLSQSKYISRKWSLTNTGVGGFTSYSATFTFVSGDKVGSPNTSSLVVRRYNGSAWSTTTTGTQGSLSTQCTGLTAFSDFAIGEDDCATAELWLGGTSTDWQTGSNWCNNNPPSSSDNVMIPSGTPFMPHISATGNGACNSITINSGATLTMDGSYTLDVYGNWTREGTFTPSTSTVNFRGTGAQTINSATTFSTLSVNNAAGVTLGAAVTVGTLTIGNVTSSSVFNDGGYQVTSTGTLNLTSGTFKLGNGASATTWPAFATANISSGTTVNYGSAAQQTIAAANYATLTNTGNGNRTLASSGTVGISGAFTPGSGSYIVTGSTVDFNAAGPQTVNGITYNNLTISGTGNNVKTAAGNITVNGVLNLASANASTTKGALNMGLVPDPEYVLYMGATATTTGTGDVSGYVNRSYFELSTNYTFGNQFTLMRFTAGPLPTSVTLELYLVDANLTWKPDAIHRYYDITRTGGSADTRLRFNVHYLDSELNGAVEGNLDLFDYHVDAATLHDHGFTDYNTTDNWVGFGNVGLAFLGMSTNDDHLWTLGTSTTNNTTTWIGGSPSGPTDWDLPGNWEGGVPRSTSNVIIPAGTVYAPVVPDHAMPDGSLSDGRIIASMDIQSGAVVNANVGTNPNNLTINGSSGAWSNKGTLNAGALSTIIFAGSAATVAGETNFNNVTVADGAALTPETGSVIRIAGVLSRSSTGVLNAATNPNTIEYNNAGDQTVITPNGSTAGYSTLILSGSGTKTMPVAALTVHGNFIMTGTAAATAQAAITTDGSFSLGSGTSFTAGSFSHSVGADFYNDGTTFTATGSTFTFNGSAAQALEGSTASTFDNLTLNNTAGLFLGADEAITGTLTLTAGKVILENHNLTLNTTNAVAGTPGSSKYIVYTGTGKLVKSVPATMADPYLFPIGTLTNYSPATFKLTGGTVDGTSYLTVNVTEGKQPDIGSYVNYIYRYWTFTPSGTFTSPVYNAAFTYMDDDVVGNEGSVKAAKYSSGWTVYGAATLATNLLTITGATSFSDYTGFGDLAAAPSANNNPVCAGTLITISANATGGKTSYSYAWTVPGGVTNPGNVPSMVNLSATVPGTYSVVVTDADGATASGSMTLSLIDLQTITVNYVYYNLNLTPLASGITVQLWQDGSSKAQVTTVNGSGNYVFNNMCPGTYEVRTTSTTSVSGAINTTDAAQVNAWSVNPYSIEKVRFYAGNVYDELFFLNSTDALKIQEYFVNSYTSFSGKPNWTFWSTNAPIGSNSTPTESYPSVTLNEGSDKTLNMYGLCTGDFNRSFVPGAKKSTSSTLQLLYDGTQVAGSNQEIEVPLRIVHASTVGAVSLILHFPADLVEVQDVEMNSAFGRLDWAVNGNELRIGWNSQIPADFAAMENMLILKMRTTGAFTKGSSIRLTLAGDPLNELANGRYDVIGDALLSAAVVEGSAYGVAEQSAAATIILRNFPNPFTDATTLSYSLPFAGQVVVEVRNPMGNVVVVMVNEFQSAGDHLLKLDAARLAPGMYTATLRLSNDTQKSLGTVKLIRIR